MQTAIKLATTVTLPAAIIQALTTYVRAHPPSPLHATQLC